FGLVSGRAYPQLKHVLAQAGRRTQRSLLQAPPRFGGAFFNVEAPDGNHRRCRSQSSSASRFTAGASGFLLLIQCGERPDLYASPPPTTRVSTTEAATDAPRTVATGRGAAAPSLALDGIERA